MQTAIKQQPKKAPMDEITAIELLREVLLGENRTTLPPNSVQVRKRAQDESAKAPTSSAAVTPNKTAALSETNKSPPISANPKANETQPISDTPDTVNDNETNDDEPAYVSDDEDEDEGNAYRMRRSKRVAARGTKQTSRGTRHTEVRDQLHKIMNLTAHETATVPDVAINVNRKLSRGWSQANEQLQLGEWAHAMYFAGAIIDDTTGKSLEYRDLMKIDKYRDTWAKSLANEIGRLSQGIRDIAGTNTIEFIRKADIPKDRRRDITYGRIVVAYRPQKTEPNRSRLTVGGDRINYPFEVSTPTADLPTIKMLWNSVLSTPKAKFITLDVANFYLGTPMERPEYMRLPIKIIPQEIIDKYDLEKKVEDGWVYVKILKGMYGLPQAGLLANNLLSKRLVAAGYYQCQFTPGLWRHVWRPITFALVVDDFGIKVSGDVHANHLVQTLTKHYDVTIDWKGELFVGIKLEWDYKNRTLDTHIPDFVPKALHKYQHPKPAKPQHAPAKAVPIQYGAKVQTATTDTSPQISAERIRHIQDVVGTFAYYSRAVDPTMAATMSSIASRQSSATEKLEEEVKQFLDYCATHPNAGVRFVASDMIMALHSDASYLSEPEAKSRAAGHFYLGMKNDEAFDNGAILTLSKIIKHVMSSASEAETAALFYNCKAATPLRVTLQEMGHPQPKTPVTTDNSTAQGLINKTMIPKAAKSYDMRFNYLKCREAQRQFDFIWRRGRNTKADYHSKHHPVKHYIEKRPNYVVDMPLIKQ